MASKQYQIVLTMNAKQVENYLKTLKHRASEVRKEMDDMVLENGTPKDAEKYGQLAKELRILEDSIHATTTELRDYRDVVKDLSGSKLYELRRALKQVKREMEKVSEKDTSRLAELQEDYRKIDDQIKKITGNYKKQGNVISQVAKRLSAYVLIYSGFNVVKDKLGEVLKMNLALSDSLADIRKTTGLANNEVEALANSLLKLDTRTTAEELNQLAYEAGRMGVGKFGVEGVEGFVRAANQIKVALGEDLGEESIQQVYKLADVMGVIPTLGVEGSLLSIGSALNELTQTGTSSGEFIVDFTSRMAGIARQANLTTAEVTAFGSALDEMGQEVEVSATSMNKFVMQMFTHYDLVAKAADMAPEALKSMLEAGKTADAIVAVMEGLSDRGGLSQLAPLFEDLGSDGARLSQTLAAMASNVDKVKSSLEVARGAFNDARSVTNEYNIKNKTTAALLERIKNSWTELFVNSKNKGAIHGFVEDLKDMSDSLQSNWYFMTLLETTMTGLVVLVKAFVALLPTLITFFAMRAGVELTLIAWRSLSAVWTGSVAVINLLVVGFQRMAGVQAACATSTLRMVAAWKALSTAMKANIIVAVASAVIGLVTALADSHEEVDKSVEDMKRLNKAYNSYNKNLLEEQTRTNGLFNVLKNKDSTREERMEAIRILNKEYGEYLPNLLTEKSSLDEITKSQIELNKAMTRGIAMRAKQNAMREVLDPIYEDLSENMGDYTMKFKKSKRLSGYDPGVAAAAIRELADKGMSAKDIFAEVLSNAEIASGYTNVGNYKLSAYGSGVASYNEAQKIMMPLIENFVRLKQMIDQINAKFDPLIGPDSTSGNGTKITKKKKNGKNKQDNKDLHDSKKKYDALISDIKAFFELQKAAAFSKFNKGEMSDEDLAAFLREYDKMERTTTQKARAGIAEGKVGEWDSYKKDLSGKIFLDNSKEARKIMADIVSANVPGISDILTRLGEGEIDAIRKKGAEDSRKVQEEQAKFQKEINTLLLAQSYMAENAHKFQAQFEKLELLNLNRTDSLTDLGGNMSLSAKDMKSKWEDTFNYLRKRYEELFYIDINTEEGQRQFREFLAPLEHDFPDLIDMNEAKLKIFFKTIMDFHDEDDQARKKAEKDEENLMRYRFNSMSGTKDNESAQRDKEHEMGWMKLMGSVGLSTDSLMADSEVELYKLKLEAAQDYYQYVLTHAEEKANIDKAQQQLDQATMDLTEKLVAQVETHLAYLKEYGGAIEDFGTDFGEAVFGSLSDRQQAIEDLGKSFAKTTQKILLDWVKQRMMQKLQNKLMEKEEERHLSNMEGKEEQSLNFREFISAIFGKTRVKTEEKVSSEVSQKHEEATSKDVATTAKGAQANASLSAAEGAAKTIAKLGWWGIPLVAVITALINGLIGMAMSKVTALFGSSAGGDAGKIAAPKTKLVSGMLTYDEGNVQQVARYMGDDGVIYTVTKNVDELDTGMVTAPIATRVNGSPALVGEKGPEMVIGRETTAALMVSRPDLLRDIIRFDRYHSGRGYRTYDMGNVGDFSDGMPIDEQNAKMMQALQDLTAVNAALTAQLRSGIRAHIAKYGPGGIADEVVDALDFKMRQGNDEKLKRLFRR